VVPTTRKTVKDSAGVGIPGMTGEVAVTSPCTREGV
jgi:hypothetical protein